jgi:hypothetical protein
MQAALRVELATRAARTLERPRAQPVSGNNSSRERSLRNSVIPKLRSHFVHNIFLFGERRRQRICEPANSFGQL